MIEVTGKQTHAGRMRDNDVYAQGQSHGLAEPVANPHLISLYYCSKQMSPWYRIGLRSLLHPSCTHSLVLTAGTDSVVLEQSCKAVVIAQILHNLVAHISLSTSPRPAC